jgi:hypothetical protein
LHFFRETNQVAAARKIATRNGFISELAQLLEPEQRNKSLHFSAGRHPCSTAWREMPLMDKIPQSSLRNIHQRLLTATESYGCSDFREALRSASQNFLQARNFRCSLW